MLHSQLMWHVLAIAVIVARKDTVPERFSRRPHEVRANDLGEM